MAILLEFKYDKRLGLPGYSSHDFGVSMRTEVNNVEEIKEESERAYRLLQQSVDAQLVTLVSYLLKMVRKQRVRKPDQKQILKNGTAPKDNGD